MRKIILASFVSLAFAAPASAHEALLTHSHESLTKVAHSDYKPHTHLEKLKKLKKFKAAAEDNNSAE